MQEPDSWLGSNPKTAEERAKEIDQLSEFFDLMTWQPLLLTARWPWWPLVERARGRWHASAAYGELERFGFEVLCTVGVICQLLTIWTLCVNSVLAKQPMMPNAATLAWFLGVYAGLTVVRIYFWMRDNLST